MEELKVFFQNKRNVAALIALIILLVAIPLGIYLARTTQIFKPRAQETGAITLADCAGAITLEGCNCVTTDASGNKVLTCEKVPLRLVAPLFGEPSPSPSPSPSTAVTQKRVFVTSSTYSGALGGLEGADVECQVAADAADPEGLGGDWKAWLSGDADVDADVDAASRLTHDGGPYTLVDGTTVVAQNWTDLTDGTLLNQINMTESGELLTIGIGQNGVWTNTGANGAIPANKASCDGWTSSESSVLGRIGSKDQKDPGWTLVNDPSISCENDTLKLYCFEQ